MGSGSDKDWEEGSDRVAGNAESKSACLPASDHSRFPRPASRVPLPASRPINRAATIPRILPTRFQPSFLTEPESEPDRTPPSLPPCFSPTDASLQ